MRKLREPDPTGRTYNLDVWYVYSADRGGVDLSIQGLNSILLKHHGHRRAFRFTDNCTGQYKSRKNFFQLHVLCKLHGCIASTDHRSSTDVCLRFQIRSHTPPIRRGVPLQGHTRRAWSCPERGSSGRRAIGTSKVRAHCHRDNGIMHGERDGLGHQIKLIRSLCPFVMCAQAGDQFRSVSLCQRQSERALQEAPPRCWHVQGVRVSPLVHSQ